MFEDKNDSFVRDVTNRTVCDKHNVVQHGRPCWWIHTLAGGLHMAVCNSRAKRAGFVGEIDPRSLRRK